jgi:hypothetical protein
MFRDLRHDPRLASAFATFVCAWALGMATLALATTPHGESPPEARIAFSVEAGR